MTRALVVFESMFGNTETVARAVAAGIGEQLAVDVVRAGPGVTVGDDVALLVVGGPTQAFSLSRPGTRASAGQQGAPAGVARGPGLREWIDTLQPPRPAPVLATFDTRIRKHGMPGSAARAAEKRLRRLGLRTIAPATSFWVAGSPGPLLDGEVERARTWGVELGGRLLPLAAR